MQYLEIVGFVGTLQADSSTLQVTSASAGVFNADATWDKTLGLIKVSLNAALYAGTPYAFSFSIRNSATPSVSGVNVTISVPQISSTLSTMDIQGTGLLDIMSSSWTTAVISQTSNWPCAQNIISVLIAASIDVDKERVNRLTISGRLRFQDCDGENGTRIHAHTCRVAKHRLLGWQYTLTKRGPHQASSVKHRKCWQHLMWQRHGCQRFCCRYVGRYVGIRSKRVSFSRVHWQEPK